MAVTKIVNKARILESKLKESRYQPDPRFEVGDIVHPLYNNYGSGSTKDEHWKVTEVGGYDRMNGYTYVIKPFNDIAKDFAAQNPEYEEGAEIQGFENSPEEQDWGLVESDKSKDIEESFSHKEILRQSKGSFDIIVYKNTQDDDSDQTTYTVYADDRLIKELYDLDDLKDYLTLYGIKSDGLSESLEDDSSVLELAQMGFEMGHRLDRDDFDNEEEWDEYLEYVNMGPAGFYEEFKDQLDFDPDFVAMYGDDEYDESLNLDSYGKALKRAIKNLTLDSDEELRDFVNKVVDEVIAERKD